MPIRGPDRMPIDTGAQEQRNAVNGRATAPEAEKPPTVLTGKERLGKKWMDEQRIDNCKVPIDQQGTRPRPDTCSQTR